MLTIRGYKKHATYRVLERLSSSMFIIVSRPGGGLLPGRVGCWGTAAELAVDPTAPRAAVAHWLRAGSAAARVTRRPEGTAAMAEAALNLVLGNYWPVLLLAPALLKSVQINNFF